MSESVSYLAEPERSWSLWFYVCIWGKGCEKHPPLPKISASETISKLEISTFPLNLTLPSKNNINNKLQMFENLKIFLSFWKNKNFIFDHNQVEILDLHQVTKSPFLFFFKQWRIWLRALICYVKAMQFESHAVVGGRCKNTYPLKS